MIRLGSKWWIQLTLMWACVIIISIKLGQICQICCRVGGTMLRTGRKRRTQGTQRRKRLRPGRQTNVDNANNLAGDNNGGRWWGENLIKARKRERLVLAGVGSGQREDLSRVRKWEGSSTMMFTGKALDKTGSRIWALDWVWPEDLVLEHFS